MGALAARLWQLCVLRIGPQDLPHSTLLARLLVLAVLVVGMLNALVGGRDATMFVPRSLLTLVFLLAVPWALLRWRGFGARFTQTVTAIAGSSLFYGLAFLPISLMASGYEPGLPPAPTVVAATWLGLLFTGWKLAINGHIWHHALEMPRVLGLVLAFLLFMIQVGLDWRIMVLLGLVEPAAQ